MNPYPKYEEHGYLNDACRPERARVTLDEYNSDLNFVIGHDMLTGSSLHKDGFEYLWAGARATHGVSRGKVCYEILVQEKLEVNMPETERSPHVMRVGWSTDGSNFTVGEAPLSYGYGGTGKISCNNNFYDYGEAFSTNDVITCYIDLDVVPKTIFFTKNGKYLGVAFRMGPETDGRVFYPHVTVKNMKFVANFGGCQPFYPPVQGFCLLEFLPANLLILPPVCPKERRDCEVLMMVGLPSCGKTTWLEKFVKDNPEKKYYVLGTNAILCKMKVMGLTRKRNYHGRWDALIKQATGILNEMLKIAPHKNRNYILDQTNVYPNARRRKMNNFRGYRHIAVVIVNTNSVLKERSEKVVRQDGKVVPESAVMEMKANFTLPVEGEIFDEVWYVDENRGRSEELVREFNGEGRAWKEEQKKRPAGDQHNHEETPSYMKRPKFEPATNFGNPPKSHYSREEHRTNRDWSHGNHSVDRASHVNSYRETSSSRPNNDSRQWNAYQGRSQDSSLHDRYSRGAPPPHSSYHHPFPSTSDNEFNAGGSSAVKTEEAPPCYQHDRAQQYDQQYHVQSRFPQQAYQIERSQYDNPQHHNVSYNWETSNWYGNQNTANDAYQDYYGNRHHTTRPPVKEETWSQEQPYGYQGQYDNYQGYRY